MSYDDEYVQPGQQVMVDGHLTGIPSLPNEQQYILEYSKWASTNKIRTYLFSSFDEPWKENSEPGKVGSHFGLYTVDSQPKFGFNPARAVSPLAYAFTLTYANGDQYRGIVYAEPEFGYTMGPVQTVIDEDGDAATYEVSNVTTSVNGTMGAVYVHNYYDAESEKNFAPVNFRTALGLNFLGSESGYIIREKTSEYFFGADDAAGVHFEADLKVGNESRFQERQGWGAGSLPPGRLKQSNGAGLIPEGQKKKFGQ